MILTPEQIRETLINLKQKGLPRGYSTKIPKFSDHLTFIKGGSTDISGYPHYGKSLFLKEVLVSLTVHHNWKHAIYMPDDGMDAEVMSNLFHKIYGKTFYKDGDRVDEGFINKFYLDFSQKFVFFTGHGLDPKEFWAKAKEAKCNSAVIDSWNYMAHQGDPNKPDYLRQILSHRNMFFQENKMHSFIIVHCKNPNPQQVIDGNVKPPTVYDIMGGSEWNNNGRNILFVHKPNKSDYTLPYTITVAKVKPKYLGTLAEIELFYDWPKQKFYVMDHMEQEKIYAYGESEEVNKEIEPFLPNEEIPF